MYLLLGRMEALVGTQRSTPVRSLMPWSSVEATDAELIGGTEAQSSLAMEAAEQAQQRTGAMRQSVSTVKREEGGAAALGCTERGGAIVVEHAAAVRRPWRVKS